jgi:hypothetical protein
MNSSWLSTKKRGRDDSKIRKDAKKALQARKRYKQQQRGATTATALVSKKKQAKNDEDDDSFQSESSVENKAWEESDEEIEQSQLDDDDEIEDSSDDEQGGDTFFQSYKPRTSVPPKRNNNKIEQKQKQRGDGPKQQLSVVAKKQQLIELLSSDDDDDTDTRKPTTRVKPCVSYQGLDDDQESDSDSIPASSGLLNKKLIASNGKQDDGDKKMPAKLLVRKPTKATVNDKLVLEAKTNWTPSKPSANHFAQAPDSPQHDRAEICNGSLTEDQALAAALAASQQQPFDSPVMSFKTNHRQKHRRRVIYEDSDSDSQQTMDKDEATALELALLESQEEANRRESNPHSQQEPFAVNEEEQDDMDEESGRDDGAYTDPEEQQASCILETANDLSKQVLAAMTSWSGGETGVVPMGMIVDGALTLSVVNDTNANTAPRGHSWISQAHMKKICPLIELADYQLIGVNWMALLHGMKCLTAGGTKRTNVNGVLADEMGLGCVVLDCVFFFRAMLF